MIPGPHGRKDDQNQGNPRPAGLAPSLPGHVIDLGLLKHTYLAPWIKEQYHRTDQKASPLDWMVHTQRKRAQVAPS